MSNALADVIADDISKAYVEKRADEWSDRIEQLFEKMTEWLPEGWTSTRSNLTMNEEMMRKHDVPARQIARLEISAPDGSKATLEPYGLWVVGANGRIDLRSPGGKFVIVDSADTNLDEPRPQWMLAPLRDRRQLKPLTRDAFVSALTA